MEIINIKRQCKRTKPKKITEKNPISKHMKTNKNHSYREQIDGYQREGGWAKWVKGIKKYKLSVIK